MPSSPLGAIHYKSKDSICIRPAYYSRFCLFARKLRVIIMIMSRADCELFICRMQGGHKQMILLVFDLEVCTVRFPVHRQNNGKTFGNFLRARFTCTHWCAEIPLLQQSDKSLHLSFIKLLHHKMSPGGE